MLIIMATIQHPNAPSISSIVRKHLDSNPSLVHSLQRNERSQKDVAKELVSVLRERYLQENSYREEIEKKGWPKEGAVAVAITRYLKDLRQNKVRGFRTAEIARMISQGSTEIEDGISCVHIDPNDCDLNLLLGDIYKGIEKQSFLYASLDPTGVVIYSRKRENSTMDSLLEKHACERRVLRPNLSMLRLILPLEARMRPGILAHVSSILADRAISIYDVLNIEGSYLTIAFLLDEKDADAGRKILMGVIRGN